MIRLQCEVPGEVYIPLFVSCQANNLFYHHNDLHYPVNCQVNFRRTLGELYEFQFFVCHLQNNHIEADAGNEILALMLPSTMLLQNV